MLSGHMHTRLGVQAPGFCNFGTWVEGFQMLRRRLLGLSRHADFFQWLVQNYGYRGTGLIGVSDLPGHSAEKASKQPSQLHSAVGRGLERHGMWLWYLPTYLPTYLPAYLPTYLPTYLASVPHACLNITQCQCRRSTKTVISESTTGALPTTQQLLATPSLALLPRSDR